MRLSAIMSFRKRTTRKAWYIAAIGCAILCLGKESQAQAAKKWLWANSGVGAEVASSASGPVVDQAGNVYVIGRFRSSGETFKFSNSATTLSTFNPDVLTIFMAKYNKEGDLLWAKSFKSGMADGELIGVDASGNVYCSGVYRDSIKIDNTTLNGSSTEYKPFLAKFTTTGNLLWARNITTALPGYYMEYGALEVDAQNNVLMAGNFGQHSISFDNIVLNNSDNSATSYDYFVVKFDAEGDAVWATSGGAPDKDDMATSLCLNSGGGFYVGTQYQDTGVVMNGGQIRVYKYNTSGSVVWDEHINATSGVLLGALTSDAQGNFYMAGTYSGVMELDNLILDDEGCFVAKYNAAGDAIWAKSTTSNAPDISIFATGIGVDQNGTISIGGSYVYSYVVPVSTITFDTITLTLQGDRDAFLAQYSNNGDVIKALNISGSLSEFGSGLKVTGDGTIYYSGSFYSPEVALDSVMLTNTPNANSNYYGKFFIAKYGEQTTTGIEKIHDPAWLKIYPNPTHGDFTVDAADPIKTIKIIDQLGRQVFYDELPVGVRKQKINISQFAKGLYHVHVSSLNGYIVKPLTVN